MHDYIIDKTCIDRIIEHNTDCFHKEYIVISSVYGISSSKRISTWDKSWTSSFYRTWFLYSDLVCCRINNCDFQEFPCTVQCIKYDRSKSVPLLWTICVFLCLVFVMHLRLFIAALWSPAGKGLTSWFLFVMVNCVLVTFPCDIPAQVWYLSLSIPDKLQRQLKLSHMEIKCYHQ